MFLFQPLLRYADFKGRASRREYWGFALLQGFWYGLLMALVTLSMGQGEGAGPTGGMLIALGLFGLSVIGLIIPNYAVLVRRLHDSGRGAMWLGLMLPSILSSVLTFGTIVTAIGAVGLGASREAFVGTALTGLGTAGLLGLIGLVCQMILVVLTLLPGERGDNRFGPDPRDPNHSYDIGTGSALNEDRLDALFAEARRTNAMTESAVRPMPTAGSPTYSTGMTTAPVFGRRGR